MNYQPMYNPLENVDHTGSFVANIGAQSTSAIRKYLNESEIWKEKKKKIADDTARKADFFTGAVKLMEEKGIDPKMVPMPNYNDKSITPEDYAEKVGNLVGQAFTINNLEKQGVDTAGLRKAMAYPDVFKQEASRLLSSHVGKKISGGYGPEVYQAVMAGRMSPAEINQKYGTSIDQAEYERIAGLQVPQPIAAPTGPYQSPAEQSQARMAAIKTASAADQPMSQGQALKDTNIAQPMPYSKAIQTVQSAGLPKEQTETLQPIISGAAARSTAQTYNRLQKPTETQFLTEKLGQGEPLDEGAKAVAGSIRAEESLTAKKDYNKMRKTEQNVSLLKVYMQDWKNRRDFEYKWGKEAIKAVDDLNVLIQKKLDVENDINAAQNWTDLDKAAPDVNVLREKARMYQNQIDDMTSKIPDLESMAQSVGSAPTRLTPPDIEKPGERKTKKGKGLEQQAREWLISRGNASPTATQIQKVMVKMQDKMNEK
jgi:hypothetical protein